MSIYRDDLLAHRLPIERAVRGRNFDARPVEVTPSSFLLRGATDTADPF